MPKKTIYVPDGIWKQMKRLKEDVNWSGIACDAFTRKLGELAAIRESRRGLIWQRGEHCGEAVVVRMDVPFA